MRSSDDHLDGEVPEKVAAIERILDSEDVAKEEIATQLDELERMAFGESGQSSKLDFDSIAAVARLARYLSRDPGHPAFATALRLIGETTTAIKPSVEMFAENTGHYGLAASLSSAISNSEARGVILIAGNLWSILGNPINEALCLASAAESVAEDLTRGRPERFSEGIGFAERALSLLEQNANLDPKSTQATRFSVRRTLARLHSEAPSSDYRKSRQIVVEYLETAIAAAPAEGLLELIDARIQAAWARMDLDASEVAGSASQLDILDLLADGRTTARGGENINAAIEHINTARDLFEANFRPVDHPQIAAGIYSLFGIILLATADVGDLDKAIDHFRNAMRINKEFLHREDARSSVNLGLAHLRRKGDRGNVLVEAEKHIREGVEFAAISGSEADQIWARHVHGLLLCQMERWADAAHTLKGALSIWHHLYTAATSRTSRLLELTIDNSLPELAAFASAKAGSNEEAAAILEQGRAKSLSVTVNREQPMLARLEGQDKVLYAKYLEAADRIQSLEAGEWRRLAGSNSMAVLTDASTPALAESRSQMAAAIDQIRQLPGFGDFRTPLEFEEIKKSSAAAGAPIVYVAATFFGGMALVVDSESIQYLSLPSLTLESLSLHSSKLIKVRREALVPRAATEQLKRWDDALEEVCQWLWSTCMAEVLTARAVIAAGRAILVAGGEMGLLPIQAAWTDGGDNPTHRTYAIDRSILTLAPSARSLSGAREAVSGDPALRFLGIGDPRPSGGEALPSAAAEVEIASAFFENKTVAIHDEATKEVVVHGLSGPFDILHLASHGSYDGAQPLSTGLHLACYTRISLADLITLPRAEPRLVVMSACESGIFTEQLADEVFSLPSALLQAGARGAIATLWKVDDATTMMLMTRFYAALRGEQKDAAEALRVAQMWMRDTKSDDRIDYFRKLAKDQDIPDRLLRALIGAAVSQPNDSPPAKSTSWAAFVYFGV